MYCFCVFRDTPPCLYEPPWGVPYTLYPIYYYLYLSPSIFLYFYAFLYLSPSIFFYLFVSLYFSPSVYLSLCLTPQRFTERQKESQRETPTHTHTPRQPPRPHPTDQKNPGKINNSETPLPLPLPPRRASPVTLHKGAIFPPFRGPNRSFLWPGWGVPASLSSPDPKTPQILRNRRRSPGAHKKGHFNRGKRPNLAPF